MSVKVGGGAVVGGLVGCVVEGAGAVVVVSWVDAGAGSVVVVAVEVGAGGRVAAAAAREWDPLPPQAARTAGATSGTTIHL
ncbi:MAG TPA: hypothetical protein VFH58_12405 [Acidimicrobiales bacterium]|nr:hypothetical protein [Acidimicrobiales bacterium]